MESKKLKNFIDEYISELSKDIPPEILSKEIDVLYDFHKWVENYPYLTWKTWWKKFKNRIK